MIHIAEKNALQSLLCLFMHNIGFQNPGSNAWVELCDQSFFRFRFIACHKYYCTSYISNQMKNPCLDDTSTLVGWLTANQVSIYTLYVHHIREKAIIFARKTSILTRDLVNGNGGTIGSGIPTNEYVWVTPEARTRLRFPCMNALRGRSTVVRSKRTYSKPSRVFFLNQLFRLRHRSFFLVYSRREHVEASECSLFLCWPWDFIHKSCRFRFCWPGK